MHDSSQILEENDLSKKKSPPSSDRTDSSFAPSTLLQKMNCSESPLGRYLSAHGGAFHPVLEFRTGSSPASTLSFSRPSDARTRPDTFGTSIYASTSLPEHTPAVSCPFSLTVTPTLALSALSSVLPSTDDHELMVTYLALHRLSPSDLPASVILAHKVYVDSLPKDEDMRTPLYFSEAEMELLKGTNLFGATEDRRKSWKAEWEHVVSILAIPNPALFTWFVPRSAAEPPPHHFLAGTSTSGLAPSSRPLFPTYSPFLTNSRTAPAPSPPPSSPIPLAPPLPSSSPASTR